MLTPPETGTDDWVGMSVEALPVLEALAWATRPHCGGVVLFCGTVRDRSEGRPNVSCLTYEAFDDEVLPRLAAIARAARGRWPELGPLVVLHRSGALGVGETSVVVVAAAPHRAAAFEAARFAIDAVKTSVPLWKRERWDGGDDWSVCAHPVTEVAS